MEQEGDKNGNESSSGEIEDDYSIRKVEEDNEEVLDYDEDVDDEKQQVLSADPNSRTIKAPTTDDKANIKSESKKLGSDGELSSSDGEVVSEDEGEIKDEVDEFEEGEMREDMMMDRPRTCRFFELGTCTWGDRCRFLHPGVTNKGNYDMFSDSWKKKQTRSEDFPKMEFPSAWDNPEPEPEPQIVETAWERGLRHAKELKRQALLRKVQEPDFVQKRDVISLNHTLNEDRDLEFVDQKTLGSKRRGYDPFKEYENDEYATPNPEDLRRNGRFDKLRLQSEASRYGNINVLPPMPMMHEKERIMHGMPHPPDRRTPDNIHPVTGNGDRDQRRYERRHMDTDSRRMDRDDRKLNMSAKSRTMDTDHRVKPGETSDRERGRSNNKHSGSGDQWQDPWARSIPNKARKESSSSGSSSSGSSSRSSSHSSSSRSSSRSSFSSRSSSASSVSDSSRSPSPVKPKVKKEITKTNTTKKAVITKPKAPVKPKPTTDIKTTKNTQVNSRGRPAVKKKAPPKKEKKRSASSSSEFSHSDSSASPNRKSSGSDSDSGSSSGSSDSSFSSSSDSDSDDRSKRNNRKALTKKAPSKPAGKPATVAVPSKPGSRKDVKMTIINKPSQSKAPTKPESRKRSANDGGETKGKKVNRRVELLQQLKAVEDAIAKKRAKLS